MSIPEVPPDPPPRILGSLARFLGTAPGREVLRTVGWRVDRAMIKATAGRVSLSVVRPQVLLTHVGAKSGREYVAPLTYFTDAGRVIVIASNFGQSRHPGWYHNVKANPHIRLQVRGHRGRFVGSEITGAERDRLFALAKQFIPTYAEYEKRCADRLIPVIAFTPLSDR